MWRILRWCLLYFFSFLPFIGNSQVVLTTSQILSTTKNQPKFQLQQRKLDFLKNTSHELPLINRWEVRTQTHDFDLAEQQFTFRIRPNSRKERLGQRQLNFSTIQLYQEETRHVLLEGIQKRYDACLILFFSKRRRQILEDLVSIYRSLTLAYEENADLSNLMEAEEEQQSYTFQLFDYQQEVDKSIRQIQYFTNNKTAVVLATANFLKIKTIDKRLQQINPLEPLNNPRLTLLENEINLVEKEINFEIAQSKKWLSFAQIRYGGSDPHTPFRETFNISLAFQLPVKGNARLQFNQLELDKITAENKWGEAQYFANKKRKNLLRNLTDGLKKHKQLSANLVLSEQRVIRSLQVKSTEEYTIQTLKIKAYLLKKQLSLLIIEQHIYQSYLDWLAVTGKMIELPLVNYLTEDLQRL